MSTQRRGVVPYGHVAAWGTRILRFWTAASLCLLMSGCRHRQLPPPLPAVVHPLDLPPPVPAAPSMETPPPASISTPPPPVKVTQAKPKRRPKRAAAKLPIESAPVPVETASVTPPQPIGELSAGGDSNPKNQQDANELIVYTERRLGLLSKMAASHQELQTREVQRFLQQARQALSTGDAEGAKTLATKAKLLMDDLEKWAPQP